MQNVYAYIRNKSINILDEKLTKTIITRNKIISLFTVY